MLVGGTMMVISTGVMMAATLNMETAWAPVATKAVPWVFLMGALMFVVIQRMQTYSGKEMVIIRLRSIQFLSGICFVLAGMLMIENYYHFVQPLVVKTMDSYFTYLQVVHNNWVVLMLIGAVLQMYTAHRLSSELNKNS